MKQTSIGDSSREKLGEDLHKVIAKHMRSNPDANISHVAMTIFTTAMGFIANIPDGQLREFILNEAETKLPYLIQQTIKFARLEDSPMKMADALDREITSEDGNRLAPAVAKADEIREMINDHGVFIWGVVCEPPEWWFQYTIGMYEAGLPELLCIGGRSQRNAAQISHILNDLAKQMREREKPFADGEIVNLGGKNPVKVINVDTADVTDTHTCQVAVYYGTENYAVQQVLISDPEGRFPGDPDCAEPYASFLVPTSRPAGQELH
jgi:hypothetical protein